MTLTPEDKQWIEERLGPIETRIEATESRLLTEFHKWASPMEARVRTHAAGVRALDLEMEQVAKFEGRQ